MKILILDDDLIRHKAFKQNFGHHSLTLVTTVTDCISKLSLHTYDAIFLDHDLGGKQLVQSGSEPTGYDVAKWLSENPDCCPDQIYIHSFNPEGANNIEKALQPLLNIKRDLLVQKVPGLWKIEQ